MNNTTNALPEPALFTDFIVLAEDDIDDQELLVEAISSLDDSLDVIAVTSGKKLFSLLESLPDGKYPCLIVLDYNLPEMNGSEILAKINETPRFEKVTKIIWSTSNSPMYEKVCLERGAKAYLVKPTDIQGLKNMASLMLSLCRTDP